jgi:hypothetical protein
MASFSNIESFVQGTMANDWVFQGNAAFEPVYEGNFEADIDAIAESVGDDSGYFSNDTESLEAEISQIALHDDRHYANIEDESNTFCADVAASNKSSHGSVYGGTRTTYLEKGSAQGKKQKETRMSKTVYHPVHEYEHKTPHKYSKVNKSSRTPLESWENRGERHEWIAYRLEQPPSQAGKRRKSSGRK